MQSNFQSRNADHVAKCVVIISTYQVTVVFRSCCQLTDCSYYYIVVVAAAAAAALIVFDVFVFGMATRLLDGRFGLRIPVGATDFPFSKTSGLVVRSTPISYSMNIWGTSSEA